MSGFGGVSCGVVVVEERDSRGSSVRRSRRTGTLVHATPRDSGGAVVALELVGDAGTETYMFRRGSCSLFRRFVHQGKLTVCTAGMRHQIMMSEADPAQLSKLCATLAGENSYDNNNKNSRQNSPPTRTTAATRREGGGGGGRSTVLSGRRGGTSTAGGPLVSRSANARPTSSSSRRRGRRGRRRGEGGQGGTRGGAQKRTRKVSPKKNSKEAPSPRQLPLSEDQQRAVNLVVENQKSIFFTGCAGTGKSLVLNRILTRLAEAGVSGVFPTATTGLAACQVKGTTLQQFAGIGKARGSGEEVLKVVEKRPDAVRRWKAVQVLIVDEISMLDADTFDALEYVARSLRGVQAPFGGIRLVLSGDFFQLPPVSRRGEPEKNLCFEAKSWKACVEETVELKLVFRQRDNKFVKLLSKVRWGKCTPEVLAELRGCSVTSSTVEEGSQGVGDGIEKTQLTTHKADVLRVNEERLAQLEGTEVVSRADNRGNRPDYLRQLDDSCSAPTTLRLKVGAQVILVKNLAPGRGLANGSRGVVVRFATSTSSGARLPVVRFISGLEEVIRPEEFPLYVGGAVVASRRQLPLALAWALSVHKSQGMSLDRASVCLSRAFEYGQAYVALSRVRSLEGLSVIGNIDPSKIRAHPRVVAFYRALSQERKEASLRRE
ncbi:unnamed protein product [Pylaiella littoralis]